MRRATLLSLAAMALAATACVGSSADPKAGDAATATAAGSTGTSMADSTSSTIPPDGPLVPLRGATGDQLLRNLAYPAFNTAEWFGQRGFTDPTAQVAQSPLAKEGDTATFQVSDGFGRHSVEATLVHANEDVTFWVQAGLDLSEQDLRQAADDFAATVIPAVTEVFGEIPDPGVDGDRRVAVLHVDTLTGAIGEFVSYDLLPASQFEGSNEREMLYVAADGAPIGSAPYMATLAHELQHLLDFSGRQNTPLWMAEGMAQLAERIAGYDQVISDAAYLAQEAVALNDWSAAQLDDRHYGSSYLFLTYIYEQFGASAIRDLSESELTGMAAVDALVARNGSDLDGFISDWIAAIALDDPSVGDGRFVFEADALGRACPLIAPHQVPFRATSSVPQFAPRYYSVEGNGPVEITFEGSETIGAIDDIAFRGEYLWWAGRADNSVSSMTRAFDLTEVGSATLEYRVWFDTGFNDGGVVSVSTDEGATWEVLEGRRSELVTLGTEYQVAAYTGTSGNGAQPVWVRDEIDLSRFSGSQILVRFEYATDLFEGRLGFALDNVEVASLGYSDGAEEDGGWQLEGFIRTNNRFTQPWVLTVIQPDAAQPITDVTVDGGRASITVDASLGSATLAVVATAPGVGTAADYTLSMDGALDVEVERDPDTEDFSRPCTGWELEETDSYTLAIVDEHLEMTVHQDDVFTWSANDRFHEDTTVVAQATFVGDQESLAGLMCRLNPLGFYDFEISSDGFLFAGVAHEDGFDTLQEWERSSAINTGPGAVNELRLDCIGSEISFWVNGTEVLSLTNDRLRAGNVALSAGSFVGLTDDAVVTFDDVQITGLALSEHPRLAVHHPFDTPDAGWDEVLTARGSAEVETGAYRFDVRGSNWGVEGYLDFPVADLIVDVEIRFDSVPPDALVGVACRTNTAGDQYLFLVSGDGSFNVATYLGGQFIDIVPWSPLFVLDTQPGATNHLHVECVGERLVFEVNGLVVADTIDDRVTEGNVGFVGYTFERGGLAFDVVDVVIRNP